MSGRRRVGGLALPEVHRVVEVAPGRCAGASSTKRARRLVISRASSGATPYISPRNWYGRGSDGARSAASQNDLTAVLVLAARVLRDAEADVQPRRLRMAFDGRGEDLVAGSNARSCTQVVPPIEQMLLGRIHVRGALILLGGSRRDCRRAPRRRRADCGARPCPSAASIRAHLLARVVQLAGLEEGEGEVVAVGVVGRDRSPARVRRCGSAAASLPLLQVERCQRASAPRSCRAAGARPRAGGARRPRVPGERWTTGLVAGEDCAVAVRGPLDGRGRAIATNETGKEVTTSTEGAQAADLTTCSLSAPAHRRCYQ